MAPFDPPWYKLNIDAAVEKRGFARLSIIIKNSEGAVMAAAITKKPCLGDAQIGEALAILEGMRMAADVALTPLIIEYDSKNVIDSILNGSSCRGELEWIIREIQALINQNNKYRVLYARISCNVVAHGLAKIALSNSDSRVWIEEVPNEIDYLQ